MKHRCTWAENSAPPILAAYHDREWGVPVHDDALLFEFLTLEGAQAGLSWLTVLKKRERYRQVFERFDPVRVALFTKKRVQVILQDPGIIRNRLKIESTVSNAKAILQIQKEFSSFDAYIWNFVGGQPLQNAFRTIGDLPAETEISRAMSKDLKRRGFRFVGPTVCYAFMQAVGMVNDHTTDCFRHKELKQKRISGEANRPPR
jgi:DNA-3-methyladenine glycosylase I